MASVSVQASEWAGQTNVHPIGLAILVILILITLIAKKEYVILSLMFMLVAVPSAQRVVIVTLDFSFIRILILVTILRMLFRHEHKGIKFTRADKLLYMWMIWSIIAYTLLRGEFGATVARVGYMIDAVGAYAIGRVYVRSWDDMTRVLQFLCYAAIPVAIFFLVERATGRNMFAVMGGVPEYTLIRDGRLRCQGAFLHPIMAGLFWASVLPWVYASWRNRILNRKLLIIATIAMFTIVLNTASSTPVMALMFGVLGLLMFSLRKKLAFIRWSVVFLLLSLHLVMNKPVWHLISRINVVGGSTGYHRYFLMDQAIENFFEWALIGMFSTAHWGHGLRDITNQYVLEGVRGGFIGLLLFVLFLWAIFKAIGLALKRSSSDKERWLLWSGGVVLFMHSLSFISASYFGQLISYMYVFFGIMVSLATISSSQSKRFKRETKVAKM